MDDTQDTDLHKSCECAVQSMIRLELETYYAVKDRDLTKLERIMNSGLNANHCFSESVPQDAQNGTIFQLVVQENFLDALKLILFHRSETVRAATVEYSFTYAMKNNMMDIIRLLLQAVAEDQIQMELASAFRHAMYKNLYDLVGFIIKKPDFDVNIEATWGLDRPLHIVVHHNQVDLVENLLDYHAIVDTKDRKGVTPLIVACYFSAPKCVYALLRHGANPGHKACGDLYTHHSPLHATFRYSNNADTAHHIIALLLRAGLDLRQEVWALSPNSNTNMNAQTQSCLKELSNTPQSLKTLCFVSVRKQLMAHSGGVSILRYIDELPTAPALKSYLKMKDIRL